MWTFPLPLSWTLNEKFQESRNFESDKALIIERGASKMAKILAGFTPAQPQKRRKRQKLRFETVTRKQMAQIVAEGVCHLSKQTLDREPDVVM